MEALLKVQLCVLGLPRWSNFRMHTPSSLTKRVLGVQKNALEQNLPISWLLATTHDTTTPGSLKGPYDCTASSFCRASCSRSVASQTVCNAVDAAAPCDCQTSAILCRRTGSSSCIWASHRVSAIAESRRLSAAAARFAAIQSTLGSRTTASSNAVIVELPLRAAESTVAASDENTPCTPCACQEFTLSALQSKWMATAGRKQA